MKELEQLLDTSQRADSLVEWATTNCIVGDFEYMVRLDDVKNLMEAAYLAGKKDLSYTTTFKSQVVAKSLFKFYLRNYKTFIKDTFNIEL